MRVVARKPEARNRASVATRPQESLPRSLAQRAYELLVQKITRLDLSPGSVLVERNLMDELRIGRTPIREAMQRLAIERLVEHAPNRGMFVAEITATDVQQIYEFRAVLDGYAAELAALRATAEQVKELGLLHRKLGRAAEDDEIDEYVALDRHFYQVLGEASHNALVSDSIPRIFNLHLRLWFLISNRLGGWHSIAASHQEMTRDLVAALAARDPAKARSAMESYIARRQQDLKRIL